MAKEKNYYDIIGLSEDEKSLPFNEFIKVLKTKYRKACLKYHPDKLNGKSDKEKEEAEEKFKEISEAYSVLSDEEKKNQYDRFGTVGQSTFGGMDNMDEMMEYFMRMNGFTENPFKRKGRTENVKGSNIQLKVRLTLKEIFNGGKKTVKYNRYKPCDECNGKGSENGDDTVKCPHCNGMGRIVNTQYNGFGYSQTITTCPYCNGIGEIIKNPCHKCNGTGIERKEETFTFEIPKGIQNGVYSVMKGMGNYPERSQGISGDLIMVFIIEESDGYIYNENTPFDIYVEKEVPILDCITGGSCIVENIDGKSYSFKLKPNTENESVLKLQGKGLPDGNGGNGDLRVIILHKFPKEISKEEAKLLEKLKACKNFKE